VPACGPGDTTPQAAHVPRISGSSRFQVNNAEREPEIVDLTRRR
jgi:hypothetical protein